MMRSAPGARALLRVTSVAILVVAAVWIVASRIGSHDERSSADDLAPAATATRNAAPTAGTLSASRSSIEGHRDSEPPDSSRSPAFSRHADRDSLLVTAVLPSPSYEPLDAGILIVALDAADDTELARVDSELGVLTRLRLPPTVQRVRVDVRHSTLSPASMPLVRDPIGASVEVQMIGTGSITLTATGRYASPEARAFLTPSYDRNIFDQVMENAGKPLDEGRSCRFEHVMAGAYYVVIDADGGSGAHEARRLVTVRAGRDTRVLIEDVRPAPVEVHGRLVQFDTPIAGAEFAFHAEEPLEHVVRFTTDEDGRFRTSLQLDHTYNGKLTWVWRKTEHMSIPLQWSIPISQVGDELLVRIPETFLCGSLKSTDGEYPPQLVIEAYRLADQLGSDDWLQSAPAGGTLVSSEDGAFCFMGLPPGRYRLVVGGAGHTGQRPGWDDYARTEKVVEFSDGLSTTLQLHRRSEFAVHVANSDGEPIDKAVLYRRSAGPPDAGWFRCGRTGADGLCLVTHVPEGPVEVVAMTGFRSAEQRSSRVERVDVDPEAPAAVTLVVEDATTLAVQLFRRDGEPLEFLCEVRDAAGESIPTAAKSTHTSYVHRTLPLPAGEYRVHARTKGGEVAVTTVHLAGRSTERVVTLSL